MTLTNIRAILGLTADATPTKPGVTGPLTIGLADTVRRLADANVAYCAKFTGVTNAAGGTLAIKTGATTVTGACTVSGGGGADFEAVALPTIAYLYGILIRRTDTNGGDVTLTAAASTTVLIANDGTEILLLDPSGFGTTLRDTTWTLANSTAGAATVEIHVFGKA
jgi:hypothetical protein